MCKTKQCNSGAINTDGHARVAVFPVARVTNVALGRVVNNPCAPEQMVWLRLLGLWNQQRTALGALEDRENPPRIVSKTPVAMPPNDADEGRSKSAHSTLRTNARECTLSKGRHPMMDMQLRASVKRQWHTHANGIARIVRSVLGQKGVDANPQRVHVHNNGCSQEIHCERHLCGAFAGVKHGAEQRPAVAHGGVACACVAHLHVVGVPAGDISKARVEHVVEPFCGVVLNARIFRAANVKFIVRRHDNRICVFAMCTHACLLCIPHSALEVCATLYAITHPCTRVFTLKLQP